MLEQGYGILPNKILFDDTLAPSAKLLYCYISSLCAKEGYCWARNEALAEKFGLSSDRITRLIAALKPYLEIKDGNNDRRKIFLREPSCLPSQKRLGGLVKNNDAIVNNNIKNNINNLSKDEKLQDSADVREIYTLYLKWFKLSEATGITTLEQAERRYKLTDKRRKAIKTRLADAGKSMVQAAIVGYARQENFEGRKHWAGDNDSGWVADLADFICRSYEQTEKGANYFEAQSKANKSNDPWAKL